ncbi:hypothetical protein [Bartonella sp. DGB1]|uniref:hypothetical protein n=1 Tax=Bartonella sp. DGB1 TaxID=3239807 RepID=UPI0035252955
MTKVSQAKKMDFIGKEDLEKMLSAQLHENLSSSKKTDNSVNELRTLDFTCDNNITEKSTNFVEDELPSDHKSFLPEFVPANDTKMLVDVDNNYAKDRSYNWRTNIASGFWILGGTILSYRAFPEAFSSMNNFFTFLSSSTGLITTLSIFIPAFLFQGIARISRQAKQMEKIAQVMDTTAQRLNQPELVASECISNLNKNIRREILGNEARMRSLLNDLVQERRLVINQAQRVHSSIERVQKNLQNDLDQNGEYLSKDLKKIYYNIQEAITESRNNMAQDLRLAMDTMLQQVNQKLFDFSSKLSESGNQVSEQIEHHITKVTFDNLQKFTDKTSEFVQQFSELGEENINKLSTKADAIYSGIEQQTDQLISKLESKTSNMQEHIGDIYSQINSYDTQLIDNFENINERFNTALNAGQEKFSNLIEHSVGDLFGRNYQKLQDQLQVESNNLQDRMSDIKEIISLGEETFNNMLSRQTAVLEQALQGSDDEIKNKLSEYIVSLEDKTHHLRDNWLKESDKLANVIEDRLEKLSSSLETTSDKLHNVFSSQIELVEKNSDILQSTYELQEALIDQGQAAIASTFDRNKETFNNSVQEQVKNLNDQLELAHSTLEDKFSTIKNDLHDISSIMSETIEKNMSDTVQNLISGAEKTADILENIDNKVTRNLDENLNKLNSNVNAISYQLTNDMKQQTNNILDNFQEIGHKLRGELVDIENNFTGISERMVNNITESSSKVERLNQNLVSNLNFAQENFSQAGDNLEQHINTIFSKGHNSLTQQLSQVQTAYGELEQNIEALSNKTSVRLEQDLSSINELLLHRSQEITQTIKDTGRPLANLVNNLNNDIASSINEHMIKHINNENDALMAAFKRRAQETINVVNEMNQNITNDSSAVIDSLSTSTQELNQKLDNVLNNITIVESSIKDTTQSLVDHTQEACSIFNKGVNYLNEEFSKLGISAEAALERMALFTQGFNKQSRFFEQSLNNFELKHNNLNTNLEEREKSLAMLSNNLVSQTEMIEKALSSFDLLSRTLLQKENSILHLSDRMRGMIATEIKKALSEFYEAGAQIRQYQSQKFSNNISPDVKHENDKMLHKAIQQQKQSLDHLANLSSNFYNKNSIEDTKIDNQNEQLFIAPSTSTRTTLSGSQTNKDNKVVFSAPMVDRKPTTEFKTPMFLNDLKENFTSNKNNFMKDQPSNKSSGWVSNLLARASQVEESNLNKHNSPTNESLSENISLVDLSSKIISLSDSKSLSRLWRYYYSGNKDVFSDKIYSLDAQDLLKKIRHSYNNNHKFAKTVKQYLQEFESLLDNIKSKGSSFERLEKYLISDSGKVYSMLAIACNHL